VLPQGSAILKLKQPWIGLTLSNVKKVTVQRAYYACDAINAIYNNRRGSRRVYLQLTTRLAALATESSERARAHKYTSGETFVRHMRITGDPAGKQVVGMSFFFKLAGAPAL
jgi:hypothetical protein